MLNGFMTRFTFQTATTTTAHGFAFVFHNSGIAAAGGNTPKHCKNTQKHWKSSCSSRLGSGQNIGYNFANSVAIEFDSSQDGVCNDANNNHICALAGSAVTHPGAVSLRSGAHSILWRQQLSGVRRWQRKRCFCPRR